MHEAYGGGSLVYILAGGVRVNDHVLLGLFEYSDPLPIPDLYGFW